MQMYNDIDEELHIYTTSALYRKGAALYAEAKREKATVGLLGIHFSETVRIRSMLGGYAAMEARIELVRRVSKNLPDNHLIGRGTDGIVVCLPDYTKEMTREVADKMVKDLNEPFEYKDYNFDLAPTMTVCEYPADTGYVDVNEVSRIWGSFIDMAIKRDLQVNVMEAEDLFQIHEKHHIDRCLFDAISQNEFKLVFQPSVNMETGKVVGCEALLRWQSAELGDVGPAVFIPRAEATGIIHSITPWIIEKAGLASKLFQQKFGQGFRTSINISPVNLHSPRLMESMKQALEKSGVTAECLNFEITESLLLENKTMVMQHLEAMRQQGAHTALDDFGTGFSSLNMLTRIPLDVLKIDQSFVQKLGKPDSATDLNVVRAIRDLGKACGLNIVAEGMETKEQVDMLVNELDIKHGQGFYFGRPISASDFVETYH